MEVLGFSFSEFIIDRLVRSIGPKYDPDSGASRASCKNCQLTCGERPRELKGGSLAILYSAFGRFKKVGAVKILGHCLWPKGPKKVSIAQG